MGTRARALRQSVPRTRTLFPAEQREPGVRACFRMNDSCRVHGEAARIRFTITYFAVLFVSGELPGKGPMFAELNAQFPFFLDLDLPEECPTALYEGLALKWKSDNRGAFIGHLLREVKLLLRHGKEGKVFTVSSALAHVVGSVRSPWSESEDSLRAELRERLIGV